MPLMFDQRNDFLTGQRGRLRTDSKQEEGAALPPNERRRPKVQPVACSLGRVTHAEFQQVPIADQRFEHLLQVVPKPVAWVDEFEYGPLHSRDEPGWASWAQK